MPVVRFGAFELDVGAGELRSQGRTAHLQDKPLSLLCLLLQHPNTLLTREEICDRLWGPSKFHDFDASLNQAMRKLRDALGDDASDPKVIETIPRRGYRMIAPVEPARSPVASARRTVGRDRELTELRSAFRDSAERRGRMVCVSGDPGIGKTTLAESLLAELTADGSCRIAVGRCSERFAGSEAYLPVLEALESLLRSDESVAPILRAAAPSWFAEMPGSVAEGMAATQERRKREFVAFVDAITADRPLVLFIDDAHWADPSSVDLLSYVGSRCGDRRLFILATYRPSDLARADHPFLQVKRELQAHRLCRDIAIAFLTLEDVRRYVDLTFEGHQFPEGFAEWLFNRTEGYPLFLVDLLQDLKHAGIVAQENGAWRLTQRFDEIENLPDSVKAMVERQIGSLSAADRQLLEAASVEGHVFHSATVASMLGMDVAQAEDALHHVQALHGLIRFQGQDGTLASRYAFSHSLYVQAVYGSLRTMRRVELSAAAAGALSARQAGSSALQLATLYEAARDWQRASEYFIAAAGNAAKLSGYREAAALYRRAIEVANLLESPARDRRVLEATLHLARTRQVLSEFDEAIATYETAERLAESVGDVETRIDAICGAAFSEGYLKRTDGMRERASKAVEIAKLAGVSPAYPESVLGYQQIFVGELAASRDNHERSLAVLRKRGPDLASVFATVSFGFLNDLQSEYERADALLTAAIAEIRRSGFWSDLLRATWFHGMVQANLGRLDDALSTLTKGMQLAELNGERFWYSRFPNTIGWIHGEMGDLDQAVRMNTEGIRAGRDGGTLEAEANSHINLVSAYISLGDLRSAREHLSEGERILNEDAQKHWLRWRFRIRFHLAEAALLIATGDTEGARVAAHTARERAEATLSRKHIASARRILGDIASLEGRMDDAERQYEAALAIVKRHPCPLEERKLLRVGSRV